MPSPSSNTCRPTKSALLPALDADSGAGGSVFRRVVQKIEQGLLEQDRVDLHHGQVLGELDLNPVLREDLAGAFKSAADHLAEIVQGGVRDNCAGLQLGHVEQIGDESIEPLGFIDDRWQ